MSLALSLTIKYYHILKLNCRRKQNMTRFVKSRPQYRLASKYKIIMYLFKSPVI